MSRQEGRNTPEARGREGAVWSGVILPTSDKLGVHRGGISYTWGSGNCCGPEDINKERND